MLIFYVRIALGLVPGSQDGLIPPLTGHPQLLSWASQRPLLWADLAEENSKTLGMLFFPL